MQIPRREPGDDAEWLRMRSALWPDATELEHQADMAQWAARPEAAVFVAVRPGGEKRAGFAEVGTRSYADGCETSPVGYL